MYFLTPVYMKKLGLKNSIWLTHVLLFIISYFQAEAPSVLILFVTSILLGLAAPQQPLTIALQVGQVDSTEKGKMLGVFRMQEALGKLVGYIFFGNMIMSKYLAAFTPADSCMSLNYAPGMLYCKEPQAIALGLEFPACHNCECGVDDCPNNTAIWDARFELSSGKAWNETTQATTTHSGQRQPPLAWREERI